MCRFCLFDCRIEIEHLRSKRNPACKARFFFSFRSKAGFLSRGGSKNVSFSTASKKSGLPTALLYSEASACALFRAEFDFFALKDHICGAHGAHFAAHRAGMTLGRRNLIIEPLCLFRVECQRELRGHSTRKRQSGSRIRFRRPSVIPARCAAKCAPCAPQI